MKRQNFKSDLVLKVTMSRPEDSGKDGQVEIPEHVRVEFFVPDGRAVITAERNGDRTTLCKLSEDKMTLEMYLPLSRSPLGIGSLMMVVTEYSQAGGFPDDVKEIHSPVLTGIQLWKGASDGGSSVTVEAELVAWRYGYSAYELAKLHGFEGTEEEFIQWLRKPAEDAANTAAEAAAAAKAAQSGVTALEASVEKDRKGGYMRALYEAEGAKYNEATGFYELNGLKDITEAQMAVIYNESMRFPKNSPYLAGCHAQSAARTIFKPATAAIILANSSSGFEIFAWCKYIEYIPISTGNVVRSLGSLMYAFAWCERLKFIKGPLRIKDITILNAFLGCAMLENVFLSEFSGGDLSFSDSPKLNYTSLRWLVDKAANTAAVTVTVHATTYGYLTGAAAPTGQVGGTAEQWAQLLADAAARKISFATA